MFIDAGEATPYQTILAAPCCRLGVRYRAEALTQIDFLPLAGDLLAPGDAFGTRIAAQMAAYWADPTFVFDLPIEWQGTEFGLRVWRALGDIPSGTALTYGELAAKLGTAPRAVGGACGRNRIPIVIPCHRVVGQTGLGGFMQGKQGMSLSIKAYLLAHEGWHANA